MQLFKLKLRNFFQGRYEETDQVDPGTLRLVQAGPGRAA